MKQLIEETDFQSLWISILTAKKVSILTQDFPMISVRDKSCEWFGMTDKSHYECDIEEVSFRFREKDIDTYQATDTAVVIFFKNGTELHIQEYRV